MVLTMLYQGRIYSNDHVILVQTANYHVVTGIVNQSATLLFTRDLTSDSNNRPPLTSDSNNKSEFPTIVHHGLVSVSSNQPHSTMKAPLIP